MNLISVLVCVCVCTVDIESTIVGDSQFFTFVMVRPILIYAYALSPILSTHVYIYIYVCVWGREHVKNKDIKDKNLKKTNSLADLFFL